MKRLLTLSIALVFAALLLVGCGGKKESAPVAGVPAGTPAAVEYKDTMNVVFEAEPSTLFPYANSEIWTATIERLIFNCLIYRANDDSQEFVAEIAHKWEYLNESTIRFYLNDNVFFSNGEKLTADDVKFSLELANTMPIVLFYGLLEKVDVVDPLTVDVFTKGPNAALFSNLAHARSSIISKKYYEEVGLEEYARNPIGSGPYALAAWNTGASIDLTARDDYWGEKAATKNIHCTFISESANRSVEIETGAADIVMNPDPNDLDRIRELGFNVIDNKSYLISQVTINHENVPDIKIRQALAYAIDYAALIDAVYGKTATVADGIMPNLMPGYVKNWDITYDPEKAKQLIAESSSPNGIELEALCVNLTENIQLAEALQYYWRQVGINVRITQGAQAALRQRSDNGDYQISPSFSNWATGDPSRATSNFNGLKPLNLKLPKAAQDELADYWNRALAEIDVPKRMEIYREFQEKIKEHWVFIPLAHKRLSYLSTKNVEGFYPAPGGSPDLFMVKVKK